ncbi:AbrB/MazE/SpoVT family DNA-binding domain-containing protein [Pseudomonas jilinensis]|uniref:AbrB/MazE/SpoVT family DNA-binding domain-containing protein n=1 Tax=Pseudomonas jilinensis TaxID=2078689 RepID=A0A396RXP5_9PSED|nr:AbrB/MazE/SpoVT family DNA-binding domain-containing protein [Pseudomonas jilinensis]RHW21387.1 hypothetical protein C2846_09735 [Pseudomonas jilinensis]
MKQHVVVEDWDGDGGIRIPDEVLQEMGLGVGDSLYLFEEYMGTTRCLVLSKTPRNIKPIESKEALGKEE